LGKIAQRPEHVATADVTHINDREAGIAQHGGDGSGIADRIGERGRALISRVADHERHAFMRLRASITGDDREQPYNNKERPSAHRASLPNALRMTEDSNFYRRRVPKCSARLGLARLPT